MSHILTNREALYAMVFNLYAIEFIWYAIVFSLYAIVFNFEIYAHLFSQIRVKCGEYETSQRLEDRKVVFALLATMRGDKGGEEARRRGNPIHLPVPIGNHTIQTVIARSCLIQVT